mmetsp:Transcript_10837/g.46160  ORF Transcript_10837/g.46160 Transcript_10837/m.46160 type:complete len:678 (+) Transcript_10837:3490-5523(+)
MMSRSGSMDEFGSSARSSRLLPRVEDAPAPSTFGMFMACFGGPGLLFDDSPPYGTGLEPLDLDLFRWWCFSSLRAPEEGRGRGAPAFSRANPSARAESSSSSPFESGARLPLRAAARRVTPRAGPPRPERVGGDTRQADVDFTREPAGAPDVLAEQLAARAKAFISKTRSVFARWRRYGHARRSRDAARCGRAGAAPASVEVPDTTRTEKKESLFGLGREIPPSSANHLSTVGTSFFARGIFLFYASGRIRPRLTVRAVRPAIPRSRRIRDPPPRGVTAENSARRGERAPLERGTASSNVDRGRVAVARVRTGGSTRHRRVKEREGTRRKTGTTRVVVLCIFFSGFSRFPFTALLLKTKRRRSIRPFVLEPRLSVHGEAQVVVPSRLTQLGEVSVAVAQHAVHRGVALLDGELRRVRELANRGANLSCLDERAREPFARAELGGSRAGRLGYRLGFVERHDGSLEVFRGERPLTLRELLARTSVLVVGLVDAARRVASVLRLLHHRAELGVDLGNLQTALAREPAVVRRADQRHGLQRREETPVRAAERHEGGRRLGGRRRVRRLRRHRRHEGGTGRGVFGEELARVARGRGRGGGGRSVDARARRRRRGSGAAPGFRGDAAPDGDARGRRGGRDGRRGEHRRRRGTDRERSEPGSTRGELGGGRALGAGRARACGG